MRRAGLVGLLALALFLAGCGPLLDPDALQEQTDTPAERLVAGSTLAQAFVAHRARLTAVEVLLVAYPAGQGDDAGDLVFHLRASPDGPDLASERLPIAGVAHNTRYRFAFAPRPESLGRTYYLVLEATTRGPARATVWASDGDVYPEGASYHDGEPRSGDLAFRTYYDYDLAGLTADLAGALGRRGWVFLPALAALLLPGFALRRWLLPDLELDPAEAVGLAMGLSLALAPLLLLAATLVGARVGPMGAAGALVVAGVAVAWPRGRPSPGRLRPLAEAQGVPPLPLACDAEGRGECPAHPVDGTASARPFTRGGGPSRPPGQASRLPVWVGSHLLTPAAGAFAAAAGALVLRYVHAHDLALPMWGDSVHHTLITRLIAEQGRVPADYGPLVPAQPFAYHFGFHVQAAILTWLASMEPARAVLFAGQLISGLLVFPTYLFASRLAGDRRAGLVAGVVVGLVSVLPAYSVTWGRYPQPAGLAVLPAAALVAGRVLRAEGSRWRGLAAGAVASGGLVLTHPRVALLYAAYLLAHLLVAHWPVGVGSRPRARGSRAGTERPSVPAMPEWGIARGQLAPWLRAGLLAALSGALVAPWLARLASSRGAGLMLEPGPAGAFSFPLGTLTAGLDRYLLAGAIAGVGLGLLLRRLAGVEVALWVGFALALANVRLLGLPFNLMLTNEAVAIALFLPIAALDGLLAVSLATLARFDRWPRLARLAPAGLLAALGVWGGTALAGIVNPACLLATGADVDAIRWVAANTRPDAAFLINSYPWQGDIYQGSDGGYWLSVLARRRTSLPPQVYALGEPAAVARIQELAAATQARRLDPAALLPALRAAGYTHVFVGARGGALKVSALESAAGYRLVYTNGRAAVFEVAPSPASAGP